MTTWFREIDMTDWKEKDALSLGNRVTETVKDSQRFVIRPYPHKLKMTLKQYNILNGRPPNMELEFNNVLFRTTENVMDIEVEGYDKWGNPNEG